MELCRVTTSDGLQLDGSFESTGADQPAILLIHGTGSNFYGSGLLATLARQAAADSFPVLRINTRGHDLAASIPGPQGPVQGGAAYEHVLDCRFDIAAWCDFLAERGQAKILLIGHSLGGVKAMFSQALARHPAVTGVVGVSPPRFVHQKFQADPRCEAFRRDFAQAQRLIAEGQGGTLMSVTQPLPILITAAGFLEKYGSDDPLDYLRVLSSLAVPRLIVVGSDSVAKNPAFDDLPAALETVSKSDSQFQCEVIPGADINYRNDPEEPWRRIHRWIVSDAA